MHRLRPVAGLFSIILVSLLASVASAEEVDQKKSGKHRLPCNGVVSLYYGDELIWTKGPDELQAMQGLVAVPDEPQSGITGLLLSSLLSLRPDVAAIELESCKPRLRRFERGHLESEAGAALYLVATKYRGFRLRNSVKQRGRGRGMKNIGKVVLVPATAAAQGSSDKKPDAEAGEKRGRGTGGGSGSGSGQDSAGKSGKESAESG